MIHQWLFWKIADRCISSESCTNHLFILSVYTTLWRLLFFSVMFYFHTEHNSSFQRSWLEEQGYGGWMVWALDTDDFNGAFCEQGPHPLLEALQGEQPNDVRLNADTKWWSQEVLVTLDYVWTIFVISMCILTDIFIQNEYTASHLHIIAFSFELKVQPNFLDTHILCYNCFSFNGFKI